MLELGSWGHSVLQTPALVNNSVRIVTMMVAMVAILKVFSYYSRSEMKLSGRLWGSVEI